MSLLLEALKKAEKAKEEAQRRAGESAPPAAAPAQALSLQGEEPAGGKVVTRTQLPDISQPLEILSDDLSPKMAGTPDPARAPAGAAAPAAATAMRASSAPRAAAADASTQRAAGRKVFEAKFKESNPRLPFYFALGVLGAFAVGTIGYFWYQLRPPAPLVNASPPPAGEKPIAVAQVPQKGAVSSGAAGTAGSIPGLPDPTASAAAVAAPTPAPAAALPATPAPTASQAEPIQAPRAEQRAAAKAPALLRRAPEPALTARADAAPRAPQVNPKVQSGYNAYAAGDLARAGEEYREALQDEPGNRDALLGLAAVETRTGRLEAAEAIYLKLLQADPRDPHAQAGLLALRAGRQDPLAAESRVKTLLAAEPGEHVLNFALGNQLAQQERWAEAQQEYFKAFSADPENADFAYNLAVSLDHMRQPKLALEYYQRAITLAAHGASFDLSAARARAAQLAR